MQVIVSLYQAAVYQSLLLQPVVHLFARNAEFARTAFYCHDGEMNTPICIIFRVVHFKKLFSIQNLHHLPCGVLRCARFAEQASHFGIAFQLRVACLSAGQNAAQGRREAGGVHVGSY